MFLYEGVDYKKSAVYDYGGDFGKVNQSDFNGNFENIYDNESCLDEYEKNQREPKLNLGKLYSCFNIILSVNLSAFIFMVGCNK